MDERDYIALILKVHEMYSINHSIQIFAPKDIYIMNSENMSILRFASMEDLIKHLTLSP